jgi:hypothetical protein
MGIREREYWTWGPLRDQEQTAPLSTSEFLRHRIEAHPCHSITPAELFLQGKKICIEVKLC